MVHILNFPFISTVNFITVMDYIVHFFSLKTSYKMVSPPHKIIIELKIFHHLVTSWLSLTWHHNSMHYLCACGYMHSHVRPLSLLFFLFSLPICQLIKENQCKKNQTAPSIFTIRKKILKHYLTFLSHTRLLIPWILWKTDLSRLGMSYV